MAAFEAGFVIRCSFERQHINHINSLITSLAFVQSSCECHTFSFLENDPVLQNYKFSRGSSKCWTGKHLTGFRAAAPDKFWRMKKGPWLVHTKQNIYQTTQGNFCLALQWCKIDLQVHTKDWHVIGDPQHYEIYVDVIQ